eukprot:m.114172 g.114172  ORF g.114172 m.114172 type:complete len:113 (-) comp9440_c1_seq1:221-559(-)
MCYDSWTCMSRRFEWGLSHKSPFLGLSTSPCCRQTHSCPKTQTSRHLRVNDDRILEACVRYGAAHGDTHKPKGGQLKRSVVLITDDRNLKLKAHTRNVAVSDLRRFMKNMFV